LEFTDLVANRYVAKVVKTNISCGPTDPKFNWGKKSVLSYLTKFKPLNEEEEGN